MCITFKVLASSIQTFVSHGALIPLLSINIVRQNISLQSHKKKVEKLLEQKPSIMELSCHCRWKEFSAQISSPRPGFEGTTCAAGHSLLVRGCQLEKKTRNKISPFMRLGMAATYKRTWGTADVYS